MVVLHETHGSRCLPCICYCRFGSIVWAKVVGWSYWPALITDPRLLHSEFHASARELETKYYVCFYQTTDLYVTRIRLPSPSGCLTGVSFVMMV